MLSPIPELPGSTVRPVWGGVDSNLFYLYIHLCELCALVNIMKIQFSKMDTEKQKQNHRCTSYERPMEYKHDSDTCISLHVVFSGVGRATGHGGVTEEGGRAGWEEIRFILQLIKPDNREHRLWIPQVRVARSEETLSHRHTHICIIEPSQGGGVCVKQFPSQRSVSPRSNSTLQPSSVSEREWTHC